MRSLFGRRSRSSNAPGGQRRRRTPIRAGAGIEPLEQRHLLAADSGREVVLIDSALVATIPQEELAGSLVVAIDAGRDAVVVGDRIGFDATAKSEGDARPGWPVRAWPPIVRYPEEVLEKARAEIGGATPPAEPGA